MTTSFDRRLNPRGRKALACLAAEGGNWWADLLALWSPGGSPEGLRLGLRNGYLNFYSRGQLVCPLKSGPP